MKLQARSLRLEFLGMTMPQNSTLAGAASYLPASVCEAGTATVLILPGNFDFCGSL